MYVHCSRAVTYTWNFVRAAPGTLYSHYPGSETHRAVAHTRHADTMVHKIKCAGPAKVRLVALRLACQQPRYRSCPARFHVPTVVSRAPRSMCPLLHGLHRLRLQADAQGRSSMCCLHLNCHQREYLCEWNSSHGSSVMSLTGSQMGDTADAIASALGGEWAGSGDSHPDSPQLQTSQMSRSFDNDDK